ncbi:hypothetical protein KRX54_01220 [Actinomycetaceae bacterium TAE3-ERU4]|nr:hypothetical protein [Actinomycetaceae bacterium TAE3-ERU4]
MDGFLASGFAGDTSTDFVGSSSLCSLLLESSPREIWWDSQALSLEKAWEGPSAKPAQDRVDLIKQHTAELMWEAEKIESSRAGLQLAVIRLRELNAQLSVFPLPFLG